MSNRKPDPSTPSKYEKQLPTHIEDFFVYYTKHYVEGGELEDWQIELVNELADNLVDQIRKQMKSSSKARKMFFSMNKELVWEDEADMIMRLTRRNLATFDVKFIQEMNLGIKAVVQGRIEPIREILMGVVAAVSASDEERDAVQAFCSGESFFFEDLAQNLVEQDAWIGELYQRMPIIEYIRKRETFLLKIIKFEEANHNSSTRVSKISDINASKKFRLQASRTFEESNKTCRQLIDDYQRNLTKAFEIKGDVYQLRLDDQVACIANVKTNFSAFSRGVLVFVDPSDEIEQAVLSPPVQAALSDPEKYTEVEFINYVQE